MLKKYIVLLAVTITAVVLLPKNANADLGPKPTVDIDVVYNQQSVPDASFSAKMLECLQNFESDQDLSNRERNLIPQFKIKEYDSSQNCYWTPAYLAWGGDCKDSKCRIGYMPPDEFKLAVFIPSLDKVFITNEISRTRFNSYYKAELFTDGSAKISETTSVFSSTRIYSFVLALVLTIILELIVSLIFLFFAKRPKKIMVYVLLANIISLPIVWFIFPLVMVPALVIIITSEIFAVLFEACFIYFLSKRIISLKQSAILSVLNNSVSFFVGNFIFIIFGFYGKIV